MKVLVTGNSGFVGFAIARALEAFHVDLILPVRSRVDSISNLRCGSQFRVIGDINETTNWSSCLEGVDAVVHCAGVSGAGQRANPEKLWALQSVNVDGTLRLARQAAAAGVRRFIFLSSIKVNGESTRPNIPFRPEDAAMPSDAYGMSKFEAEKGLTKICCESGMDFVIIRPPMVYGPNVKGNFAMLMKLVEYGVPLPLSNIRNQRSYIAIDNLVSLVIASISHPKAANQIFLASDDYDLSTVELLQALSKAMGKSCRLFSCPPQVLAATAKCFGKTGLAEKILGSLQVDILRTKHLLGWRPIVSLEEGLSRCFPK
ncbi:NAD-dependent epimerase/dehydratase family protein [Alphaproteobacteria bacterium]|nr:NAD-dependent epimerase/dehydratase family protein [Alphaproteobacteria bacterium]